MRKVILESRNVLTGVEPSEELIIVPSGTYAIQNFAFDSESNAKLVILPKSLRQVEPYAFFGCGIKRIMYSGSRAELGRISGLKQASRYTPVERIDAIDGSIQNHYSCSYDGTVEEINPTLKSIRIQDGAQRFGSECFMIPGMCSYLSPAVEDLWLPKSFESISMYDFDALKHLKRLHLKQTKAEFLKSPLHLDCTKYFNGFVWCSEGTDEAELLEYREGQVIDKTTETTPKTVANEAEDGE